VSRPQPLVSIPVGVVIERRKAKSTWVDFVWRPTAVLPGVPDAAPWTALDSDSERTNFYAGPATIDFYRSDTPGYRDNLATGEPLLWVVLRPTGGDPPYEIAAVTAEPSEGEAFTGDTSNLVESVPMPDSVRAVLADFIAEYHVEHSFAKRTRDRADPEAMARGLPPKDHK
jgi:Protein of unknown function (DUF3305)